MKTATQGLTQTQEHDLNQQEVPTRLTLRVKALESLLVEKGLVDPAGLDALIDAYENEFGPPNAARRRAAKGRSRLQAASFLL